MKNAALALGWIVALVLGGILYVEMQTVRELHEKLTAAQEKVAAAQEAVASAKDATARMVDLEARYETLEATVARLKSAAESEKETTASVKEKIEVPDDFNPASLLKNMLGGEKAGEGTPKNPFQAMFEGERGEKMMKSSVGMTVNMQYKDLFASLNLPEDRAAALREILTEHAEASAMAGLAMMRGEAEGGEAPKPDDLLAAVSEVLDPDELATFEQYQAELPERMMRQQYELQLGMFAPGMSAKGREHSINVLVDTMLADRDMMNPAQFPSGDSGAIQSHLDRTRGHMEAAAARLAEELGPEDAELLQGFMEQQLAGLEMAATMMGTGDAEAGEKTNE